jgi:predicted nucleotidyltransferase
MRTSEQTAAVLRLLERTFEGALVGAWLHGSAVLGSLRPSSDIDILAMVEEPPDQAQRRSLLRGLLDVSVHPDSTFTGRPVELSVIVRSEVVPWRYPPNVTFQYGEWLRPEYERGVVPEAELSSDLALLLDVARRADSALVGPPPHDTLPEVSPSDVRRAAVAGVPELLDELGTDTRNVLLTLARIITTVETGTIRTKDAAADSLLTRVPEAHKRVLLDARDDYLGEETPAWQQRIEEARAFAAWCVANIEGPSPSAATNRV